MYKTIEYAPGKQVRCIGLQDPKPIPVGKQRMKVPKMNRYTNSKPKVKSLRTHFRDRKNQIIDGWKTQWYYRNKFLESCDSGSGYQHERVRKAKVAK
jgi:hypothetical protein